MSLRKIIITDDEDALDELPSDDIYQADVIIVREPTFDRPEAVRVIKSDTGACVTYGHINDALSATGALL